MSAYDCLHTKSFTVALARATTENGLVRCGVAAFAAHLPENPVTLYDLATGAEVCVITIPEPAVGMHTPEAWGDEMMGDWIDLEVVG